MVEWAQNPVRTDTHGYSGQWALVVLFVTVFLSLFYEIIPPVRYLKYAALPLLILLYIGSLKDVRHPHIYIRQYTLPFMILLLAYLVFLPRINFHGIKDMLFILCFLVFFMLFGDRKVNTRMLNILVMAAYVVVILWRDRTQSFSLAESTAFAESILSFVFGLFAVFFLLKKRYLWFLVNAITLVLSLKRIALLGLLAVLLVMLLPRRLRQAVTHPLVACGVNLLLLAALIATGNGWLDDYLVDLTGIPVSQLLMGRGHFYTVAAENIVANPLTVGLFGAGPGAAYETLDTLAATLHSDVLKIFYELGAIWFIVFIFALYAVSDWRLRILALYLNVVFLTDNVLIYVDVMVFYMILASQLSLRGAAAKTPVAGFPSAVAATD